MVFPPGRTPPRERGREGEGEHTQVERSHVLPTVLRAAPRVLPRARNKPALLLRVIENFRQTRSKPLPRWLPSHRAGRDCDRSIGNKRARASPDMKICLVVEPSAERSLSNFYRYLSPCDGREVGFQILPSKGKVFARVMTIFESGWTGKIGEGGRELFGGWFVFFLKRKSCFRIGKPWRTNLWRASMKSKFRGEV